MDALLNVLAPVVERIKDETDGAPEAVIAAQLVRACSCKTVSQLSVGGPAAASKVLGYSDSKCSHTVHSCPMVPLLRESSAFFAARSAETSDGEPPSANQDGNAGDGDNGEVDAMNEIDVSLDTAGSKIKLCTHTHHLYLRRCLPDDTDHPYHGMSYFVWMKLVRVEPIVKYKQSPPVLDDKEGSDGDLDDGGGPQSKSTEPVLSDDEGSDSEPDDGDECDDDDGNDDDATVAASKKKGRIPAKRYQFVGLPKMDKQMVGGVCACRSCFVAKWFDA